MVKTSEKSTAVTSVRVSTLSWADVRNQDPQYLTLYTIPIPSPPGSLFRPVFIALSLVFFIGGGRRRLGATSSTIEV
jgi:hypothetical protein